MPEELKWRMSVQTRPYQAQKPSILLLGGPPFFIVALLPGVIRFDLGVQMSKFLRLGTAIAFLIVGQLHCAMAQSDNSSIGSSVSATDEAAVRAIINRQTDAWNKHDNGRFRRRRHA
jgi:hypothetical protein